MHGAGPSESHFLRFILPLKLINEDEPTGPGFSLLRDDWDCERKQLIAYDMPWRDSELRKGANNALSALRVHIHNDERLMFIIVIEVGCEVHVHGLGVTASLSMYSDRPN